ncbi:MAG: bifunctional phosphoribosyl-AMP cyclohydrolase/phosphoribosyl-ATP diphosphatase HisIE [Spirochaetaceae bacterium]|jgi:phosphoribosyl-ATP pyrophosphohydrolase/phosphoribosyl-AMP cyclohydrolase|nr:bifunctional phosphoribosyl-AMP cyclohydrolase/phosphoribosyl-ATP diphosphatase HisIE [Spirochaetaceae bacterium]
MVIASIDLKDGKVVQLKNGKEKVLERDDPEELIAEFDRYGEVAVIDLDAALGNTIKPGVTVNSGIVKKLLRSGNVRVGGGIRDVKRAKELVSLGAEKVIVGSAAFLRSAEGAGSVNTAAVNTAAVNTAFLSELCEAIGRDRVIVSVDAIHGKIAVKGWTESSGIDLIEGARAVEQYASELLFTCVEREGCMTGADMELVRSLRSAVSCRLVAAGGVSSVEEITELEKMGCDVQLGMALYTRAVSLKDAFIGCLNWEKAELIPVIAQSVAGEVLMMGYANRDAFEKTFDSGKLTFWSRTRNVLWTKGEHSGNHLSVVRLRADCDRDTVLATVIPAGPVCHTGSWTCFQGSGQPPYTLEYLSGIIAERFSNPRPGSYTATLDDERVREKIMEEAEELTEAGNRDEVIWEFADLLYFMNVLMYRERVSWKDILDELDRRHKK